MKEELWNQLVEYREGNIHRPSLNSIVCLALDQFLKAQSSASWHMVRSPQLAELARRIADDTEHGWLDVAVKKASSLYQGLVELKARTRQRQSSRTSKKGE